MHYIYIYILTPIEDNCVWFKLKFRDLRLGFTMSKNRSSNDRLQRKHLKELYHGLKPKYPRRFQSQGSW